MKLTEGRTVLHLFGGRATWGVRMDIDPTVKPDVLADAWLPPFGRNSFDTVILDPPYVHLNQQMKQALLRGAGYIARRQVIWFHTMWIAAGDPLRLRRSWLVRVGDSCAVRCVQVFDVVNPDKGPPRLHFTRGPAVRYNRWLTGQRELPGTRLEGTRDTTQKSARITG